MELNQKETRHVAGAGWLSSTKAFLGIIGEQKLIAWRGNDAGVRLHIARVPAIQSVVAPCWDDVSVGSDGKYAYGQNNGFFRCPK